MRVRNLIRMLKKCNPEDVVCIPDADAGEMTPVTGCVFGNGRIEMYSDVDEEDVAHGTRRQP